MLHNVKDILQSHKIRLSRSCTITIQGRYYIISWLDNQQPVGG